MKKLLTFMKEIFVLISLTSACIILQNIQNLYMENVTDCEYIFWNYNPKYPTETISLTIFLCLFKGVTLYKCLEFVVKYWRPLPTRP